MSFGLERKTLISKPQANGERQSSDEPTPHACRNFGYFYGKITTGAIRYDDSITDRPLAILGLSSRPCIGPRQLPRKAREAQNVHSTMRNSQPHTVAVPDTRRQLSLRRTLRRPESIVDMSLGEHAFWSAR